MTEISGGELYTRRIVSYRELEEKEDNKQQLYLTLEELVDSRLITIDSDQIEVAHEALLRRWPRLHKWLEDSREQLLIERKLQRDAADWVMKDRDSSLLYRGSRLKEVLYWSNKTASKLGFNEKEFLQRSKKHQRRKFFVSGSIRIAAFLMLLVVFAIFIREIRQAKSRWQALNNSPESTIYSMTLVDLSNNKTLVDLNKPQLCVGTGSQGVLCNEGSDDGQYIYNDGGWWSIFENGIEADKPSWMDIIVGRAILNAGISDRSRAIVYIVADSANSGDIYALDINLNPLILKLGKSFKWQELTTDPKTFCTGRRYLKDYKFDVHSATVLVACYDSEDGQSYLRVGLVDENDIENSTWKTFTYPDSLPGREVSAAYIGRKDGQIYLGTEKGLYRGEATSPNSWGAPLLNLPYIQLIEPDPLSTDSLFLATYDEITEKGTVLQWEVGALNPPSIIEEYSNRPISMTAIPDLVQGWQLFILLENGDVLDIAPNRRSEIIPYHPANSIGKAFSILAVRPSSTEQPQLFLGHVDGLFELK